MNYMRKKRRKEEVDVVEIDEEIVGDEKLEERKREERENKDHHHQHKKPKILKEYKEDPLKEIQREERRDKGRELTEDLSSNEEVDIKGFRLKGERKVQPLNSHNLSALPNTPSLPGILPPPLQEEYKGDAREEEKKEIRYREEQSISHHHHHGHHRRIRENQRSRSHEHPQHKRGRGEGSTKNIMQQIPADEVVGDRERGSISLERGISISQHRNQPKQNFDITHMNLFSPTGEKSPKQLKLNPNLYVNLFYDIKQANLRKLAKIFQDNATTQIITYLHSKQEWRDVEIENLLQPEYYTNGAYWNDKRAVLDCIFHQRQIANAVLGTCTMGCILLYILDKMLENLINEILHAITTEGQSKYENINYKINPTDSMKRNILALYHKAFEYQKQYSSELENLEEFRTNLINISQPLFDNRKLNPDGLPKAQSINQEIVMLPFPLLKEGICTHQEYIRNCSSELFKMEDKEEEISRELTKYLAYANRKNSTSFNIPGQDTNFQRMKKLIRKPPQFYFSLMQEESKIIPWHDLE